MIVEPHHLERCVRRSRIRQALLLLLDDLGQAHVGHLSRAAGSAPRHVRGALLGELPFYRPELSLVGLGLAERGEDDEGEFIRITAAGRRGAREVRERRRIAST